MSPFFCWDVKITHLQSCSVQLTTVFVCRLKMNLCVCMMKTQLNAPPIKYSMTVSYCYLTLGFKLSLSLIRCQTDTLTHFQMHTNPWTWADWENNPSETSSLVDLISNLAGLCLPHHSQAREMFFNIIWREEIICYLHVWAEYLSIHVCHPWEKPLLHERLFTER